MNNETVEARGLADEDWKMKTDREQEFRTFAEPQWNLRQSIGNHWIEF